MKNIQGISFPDPTKMNHALIHQYLSTESYWAKGVPTYIVEKSIRHSMCFGLYFERSQAGFARVVTDFATFAYLANVFVLDEHRGRGLSKWLTQVIVTHPELQGLRQWMLGTADAHRLYEKYGFTPLLANPPRWMKKNDPEVYNRT